MSRQWNNHLKKLSLLYCNKGDNGIIIALSQRSYAIARKQNNHHFISRKQRVRSHSTSIYIYIYTIYTESHFFPPVFFVSSMKAYIPPFSFQKNKGNHLMLGGCLQRWKRELVKKKKNQLHLRACFDR